MFLIHTISNYNTPEDFYKDIPGCNDHNNENCLKIKNDIDTFRKEYLKKDKWIASTKLVDSPYFQKILAKSERLQKYSKNDQEEILTQIFYHSTRSNFIFNYATQAYLALALHYSDISLHKVQLFELESFLDDLEEKIKEKLELEKPQKELELELEKQEKERELEKQEMRKKSAEELVHIFEQRKNKQTEEIVQ